MSADELEKIPTIEKTIHFTFTLVFMASTLHLMAYHHENKHKQIFQENTCEDIEIQYQYLELKNPPAVTKAWDCDQEKQHKKHDKVHSQGKYIWFMWGTSNIAFMFSFMAYLGKHREKFRRGKTKMKQENKKGEK